MPEPDLKVDPDPEQSEAFRQLFDSLPPYGGHRHPDMSPRLEALEQKVDRILDLLEGRLVDVPGLGYGKKL